MFYSLLIVTLMFATLVSWLCVRIFTRPAKTILQRVIQDNIHTAWVTYLKFALYVVGISSGVRIRELEQYVSPMDAKKHGKVLLLSAERWTLELYRTIIETLQGIAGALLLYFTVTLIAFVIVRVIEIWRQGRNTGETALPRANAGS